MLEGLLPGHPGLLLQATQLTGGLVKPATGQRGLLLVLDGVPCLSSHDLQPLVSLKLDHSHANRA